MSTMKLGVDKHDFVEFLKLAANANTLVFSTNPRGEIFPTGAYRGLTKKEERVDVKGRSVLLDRVAGVYSGSIREAGGKFKIDFHGAYCKGQKRYFMEWTKSRDLIDYENSVSDEPVPKTMLEMFGQMAKRTNLV